VYRRRPAGLAEVATGGRAAGLPFEARFDFTREGILRSYEDSLLRLGLSRVDCLVIHDLETRLMSESELHHHRADLQASGWAALDELRAGGEIGAVGAGINDCSMMAYFSDRFDLDFFLVANPYTLLDQSPLREFAECEKGGIAIVKGSPYASGILATGPVSGALYDYAPATRAIVEKTRRILAVCNEFGVSLQAAALQFPLAHPAITAVIPGATAGAIVSANVANLATAIPTAFWTALKARDLLMPDAPVPPQPS
jgi:D-threo-aldose 1-dehydrogenase